MQPPYEVMVSGRSLPGDILLGYYCKVTTRMIYSWATKVRSLPRVICTLVATVEDGSMQPPYELMEPGRSLPRVTYSLATPVEDR